jgi:hypothetical protein
LGKLLLSAGLRILLALIFGAWSHHGWCRVKW